MPLGAGAKLGPYEVLTPLGAGGMGEVYRARDTRLGRDIAIKLLPAQVAQDAERLARFRREAHLLASLNHPHVAAVHGLEELNGKLVLVLELVEGEDLAERLTRGAIPIDEAIAIAQQVAKGLEAAHEKGIVHRDLKPANVKLTRDGAVKILDFGLAKACEGDAVTASEMGLSRSPTQSRPLTEAGVILGTAAYMSPEQVKGMVADRRSDIWSLGVVLFEMLSGTRMFVGETPAETRASVLKDEPDWGNLPTATPASVRLLLRHCLHKEPRGRFQAIADVRIALEDALAGPSEEPLAGEAASRRAEERGRRGVPWPTAVLASALALGLALWAPWRGTPPPKPPRRLSIELGAEATLFPGLGTAVALSPDGSTLAFVAVKDGRGPQLYLRRLDQTTVTPLSGTENARDPFFSPDSRWIGFFADGKLKKVATTGEAAISLCDVPEHDRGGTWAESGEIFFAPNSEGGLWRIPSGGGTLEPFTKADPAEGVATDRWPQSLPGDRALLFTSASTLGSYDNASLVVMRLPRGPRKVVQRGGYHGRYVRSGHLVYIHKRTLMAAPFDLDRLELAGPVVPVLESVSSNTASAEAQFAISDEGTLAYLPDSSGGREVTIEWLDQEGGRQVMRAAPADAINSPRFSPDGRRVALEISDGSQRDLWVYEWERDTMSRLTFDAENDEAPLWTPDGRRLVFASARADKALNLYWQPADGAGEVQRLTESANPQRPDTWHPDGNSLVFTEHSPQTATDLMILTLERDPVMGWRPGKPAVLLKSAFAEAFAAFSPDGRWLAYNSNETGRDEVHVRAFPGPGGMWQVSTGGGAFATWSRTRKELFYLAGDQKLMVVPYAVEGDSFRVGKTRVWSEAPLVRQAASRTFDLHPDGRRFVEVKAVTGKSESKRDHLTLVFNFGDELRRVAPTR